MRRKDDNGSANDVALAYVDPCSNAGRLHEYSEALSLREVDAQGYFRGQQRTKLKS